MLKGNGKRVVLILLLIFIFAVFGVVSDSKKLSEKSVKSAQSATLTPTKSEPIKIPTPTTYINASNILSKEKATVAKVVDGDTLSVMLNGKKETIRVIGINTPETVDPRKPVECFGKEASDKAKQLLTNQTVFLSADPTQDNRDKYDRLLRYIFYQNGTVDYGKKMIAEGYAYEYTYDVPYRFQTAYRAAQKSAEKEQKGLWAANACSDVNNKVTLPVATTTQQSASSGADKDCKDFTTHAEAQTYFDAKGGSSINNVDKLDGSDHDGVVCETLP